MRRTLGRWGVLALIALITAPIVVDATVLHVAIPTLSRELDASAVGLLWIIDIYPLMMAGLLLPMGALGDRLGVRPMLTIGLVVFGVASVMAGFSQTQGQLIISRAVLALGAAILTPATLAALRHAFDDESERAFALGVWSAVATSVAAAGPVFGGFLLSYFDWGMLFLVNVPIVVFALAFVAGLFPKMRVKSDQPWRPFDALLFIAALLLLVFGLKAGLGGRTEPLTAVAAAILGAAFLAIFARRQLRTDQTPLLNLKLLARPRVSTGVLMALTALIAIVGFDLSMVQELQFVLDFTPLQSGAFILPMAVASAVAAPLSGFFLGRLGMRFIATSGMLLASGGFFGLSWADPGTQPIVTWAFMAALGFGVGTALLAASASIISSVEKDEAGMAAGIDAMSYELGAGLGVTFFGVWLSRLYASSLVPPAGLEGAVLDRARHSIGETMQAAAALDPVQAEALRSAARAAYSGAHEVVLMASGVITLVLALVVFVKIGRHR